MSDRGPSHPPDGEGEADADERYDDSTVSEKQGRVPGESQPRQPSSHEPARGDGPLTWRRLAIAAVVVVLALLVVVGLQPGDFGGGASEASPLEVVDVELDEEHVEGEAVIVAVTVENPSEEPVEDTVTVDLGALGSQQVVVSVPDGETNTTAVEFDTATGDAGEYTASVSTGDGGVEATTSVVADSRFEVSAVDGPAELSEGTEMTVEYTVENTGSVGDTGTVALSVDGETVAETEHSLDGGEETGGQFTHEVTATSETQLSVEVATGDDSEERTVVVTEPPRQPELLVTGLQASSVTAGEDLVVTASVTNVGDVADTQPLTVDAGPLGEDADPVSLDVGGSAEETFVFPTTAADAGEYTVTAETDDDTAEATVTVQEQPDPAESSLSGLDIAGQGTDATVTENSPGDIWVGIENVGEETDSFEVTLSVGGIEETAVTSDLAGGQGATVAFEGVVESLDAGTYNVSISTDDDVVTGLLTVEPPSEAVFELSEPLADPSTADPGEEVIVSAVVENIGGVEDSQIVVLSVPTETPRQGAVETTLGPGESDAIGFALEIEEEGTHEFIFETEDDQISGTFTVG